MLIGANYFPGWWDGPRNKWYLDGQFLLDRHPERTPLLGHLSSADVIRRELVLAAESGISFFNFLWYGAEIQKPIETATYLAHDRDWLNHSFSIFERLSAESPLHFSIEWTNHNPWSHVDGRTWRRLVEQWLSIFGNERYVTIDGKLLFKIHSGHYWAASVGDRSERQRMIQYLRDAVRFELGKSILIGAGVRRLEPIVAGHPLVADGTFDFTSIYLDVPNMVRSAPDRLKVGVFTYHDLEMHQRIGRAYHAYDSVPFVPNIVVGFHPLWAFQKDLPRFEGATPAELINSIKAAQQDIDTFPGLKFPSSSAKPANLLLIYAWNEFAEGGYLAPTLGTGYGYLDAIRNLLKAGTGVEEAPKTNVPLGEPNQDTPSEVVLLPVAQKAIRVSGL